MSAPARVRELTTEEEARAAFPVMHAFTAHLDEAEFLGLLREMWPQGYHLWALEDEHGELVALAGAAIHTDLFNGRHLDIHELTTRPDRRSAGYGRQLVAYLEAWARAAGCGVVVLYSGMTRTEAHHFWEGHLGYERRGITFKKNLG